MDFAGYSIPQCNVSFEALPSLLVEYCPTNFEGWEVVEDSHGLGYWFRSLVAVGLLSRHALELIGALCLYVECDYFVWSKNDTLCIHFVRDRYNEI